MNPWRTILAALLLQLLLPQSVPADLQPSQIAIIAARGSRGSERLAEYYAEQRGIPVENICRVEMPRGETIARETWQSVVQPEIRRWLQQQDPQRELRCLVTTWDVPLRIERDSQGSPALTRYQEFLQGEKVKRVQLLRDLVAEFGLLAAGGEPAQRAGEGAANGASEAAKDSQADAAQGPAAAADFKQLQDLLEAELQQAQLRVRELSDPQARQQAATKIQQYATAIGGLQVLLEPLQKRIQGEGEAAPQYRSEFEKLRGMLLAYTEVQQQLERSAAAIERDALLLGVVTRTRGMIASVKWIDEQLKIVGKRETNSSFDSELSLVLWPDDYQLLRWQPNYLAATFSNSQYRDSFPTLMVSRIDAPTLPLAKSLIDTAIKIEKQGLEGKVYLDARGIGKLDQSQVSPGSYADFDRALLLTAKGMQELTTLDVTLDEKSELFQPGECPNAALYCGWYSLGKYVDAFDWAPGAVAYHLASGEATTLRNEQSQVWCKRMLEEGVCATIGPTYEPYLLAFPRPNEFFSLLIQGELSLVECYYQSNPFNSWMMTLIGDPLYRPFANRRVMK